MVKRIYCSMMHFSLMRVIDVDLLFSLSWFTLQTFFAATHLTGVIYKIWLQDEVSTIHALRLGWR